MPIILRPKHITALWMAKLDAMDVVEPQDRTPETYLMRQLAWMAMNPAASAPVRFSDPIEAFVGTGVWRVHCKCSESPHADPDWNLSCCFGCGAIYDNIIFPENRTDIEDVLTARRVQHHRNWDVHETLVDLVDEQVEKGETVPVHVHAAAEAMRPEVESKRPGRDKGIASRRALAEAQIIERLGKSNEL